MKTLKCIYCGVVEFKEGEGSREHAILSSLGGRKISRNVCCVGCNKTLGDNIDEPIAKDLLAISNSVGIVTGRDKDAATIKTVCDIAGSNVDLKSGGKPHFSKSTVKVEPLDDGSKRVHISARSEEEALKLLSQIAKGMGKSIDDFPSIPVKMQKLFAPTVHLDAHIGGSIHFRALTKMSLTYLGTLISPERMRNGQFDRIIEYIWSGGDADFQPTCHDYTTPFPDTDIVSNLQHRNIIYASSEEKIVIGLIELFGNLRFTVLLSERWDGPSFGSAYTVDPVSGDQKEIQLPCLENIVQHVECRKYDMSHANSALNRIFESIKQKNDTELIESIVDNAMKKHLEGKGPVFTDEMITSLSNELSSEMVRHMFRIDTEEDVDLIDHLDKVNEPSTPKN